MSQDVWVVFRGQISTEGDVPESFNDVEQVVEVVKAQKLSKSYAKLTESPFYHPNVSYGDILKVEPSKKELNEKVAVIEFSGIVSSEESGDSLFETGLGSTDVGLNPQSLDEMIAIDKQAKPVILDAFKQGIVFEPVKLINHGTYKVNVAYNASSQTELNNLREYFETHDAHFQSSQNKRYGSVGFTIETPFETAVKCLENAPGVVGCFIAFNPNDFPNIGYSEDLIPKPEEEEGEE